MKVIFLSDSTLQAQIWLKHLQTLSYEVLQPKTLAETYTAIERDGARAIVRVAEPPSVAAAICQRLKLDYPHFPILQITAANRMGAESLQTPFQDWLNADAKPPEFDRKLGNLIFFGAMRTELNDLRSHQEKTHHFSELIQELDVNLILDRVLDFFAGELGCREVMWFPEGILEKELAQLAPTPTDNSGVLHFPATRGKVRFHRKIDSEGTALYLENWNLSQVQQNLKSAKRFEVQRANGLDAVIPILASSEGGCFGHLVFIEPANWKRLKDSELMYAYEQILTAQLNQAMTYNLVQNLTFKDDLTELYNQRYLPVVLEQELSRASRTTHEFSVLFLDVDFFKMVNDTKGHLVGSSVLVELSKIFKNGIRTTDFAFRYGGDEYVIVLSGANSENAVRVAERLRKKTADTVFSVNGTQVRITVSIGIATYPEHAKSTSELMNMADEAMYYGKNKSRNVVYLAS